MGALTMGTLQELLRIHRCELMSDRIYERNTIRQKMCLKLLAPPLGKFLKLLRAYSCNVYNVLSLLLK